MKGAYKLKSSNPKYISTWDLQLILNYVANWYHNIELGIEKISKKIVVLLALCTAHRVQTFSLIKLENISTNPNGIKIAITDIMKTSGPGRDRPVLFLPHFREILKIGQAMLISQTLLFFL